MVARTLWLWLSVGWLLTWLTEAYIQSSEASICDLGPCQCTRGRLVCDCSASKIKVSNSGSDVVMWLSVGWILTWLTEAFIQSSEASICDLGPCQCTRCRLVCDCSASKIKDILLKDLEEGRFSSIIVTNCGSLHVKSRALLGLPALQLVSVANITTLTLEEQAFSYPGDSPQLLVNISHCHIPEIPSYCFHGQLRDILLSDVRVSRVRAYAFSAMDHVERLSFAGVRVDLLESQAFKKFSVDLLIIRDSVFDVLPTRTMVDVEVHQEVKLENVTVDTVRYSALRVHGPRHFRISKSTIRHIEHQGFHVHSRGSVSIIDNVFPHLEKSAFVGFTVEKRFMNEFGRQELMFENNTLIDFESAPLMFNTTGFNPRFDWIVIGQPCSCQNADYWISDLVYFSSDPSLVTPAPHVGTVLYCLNVNIPTNVKDYQKLFCNVQDSSILLTLAFISGAIVSISVVLMLFYCVFKEKAKRYINVPNSPSPLKQNKNHVLVVPDGKTYRETELHVIVEHAEPIVPAKYVSSQQGHHSKT